METKGFGWLGRKRVSRRNYRQADKQNTCMFAAQAFCDFIEWVISEGKKK